MAFANLFSSLASVDEDVRTPDRSDFTCRNKTENGSRGRKRKKQGGQPDNYNKKRCYLSQTYDAFQDCNAKAKQHQQQGGGGRRKPAGNTKQIMQDHDCKAGNDSSRCRKNQKSKTINNSAVYNKQQKQGKKINKNQQQRNRGGRSENGGGQVKRFMTQEFKDQNAILVDGRLLCRHFIFGRCVKADECQLEHVPAYNDLIKAACKFYIQGFCTKGADCPYMHKSFPCKYFHRKGRCFQKEDCKFSHEPLNEVTERLLDEVLKRDKELCELRKTDEQESSVQTANPEDSEFIDVNGEPDILKQPLRPQFYNSTGAEEETSVFQNEEPTCASDAAEPQRPPSTSSDQQEPVCYSVEAMLGPQLSRPFHSFFSAPAGQGSRSSEVTESSTNQSEAPYSLDAVLRSYKSLENSACFQTPTFSTEQSASYIPTYPPGKITEPLLGSENQNQKVPLNMKEEVNMHQEKMLKSLSPPRVCTGLISGTSPDFSYTGDHQNQGGDTSERQKPAQVTSDEVKLESSGSLVTEAEQRDGEESIRHTGSPEDHTHLRPHLSSLTSDSESPRKLFSPSFGFKEFTGRTAAPVEPVTSSACHFGARQLAAMHPDNKKTQFTPKPGTLKDYTRKKLLYCQSQISDGDDSSNGCNKTLQRPSKSLFAPAHPQDSLKSPQSAANKTSFLSGFNAPLSDIPASVPCLKSETAHSTTAPSSAGGTLLHPKQRASYLSSPPPCQVGNYVKPKCQRSASPERSPDPENDRPSAGLPQQQLPDASPPRDAAAETSTKSVLKSLFVSLRPYQEDGEKQDSSQSTVHPDGEMKAKSNLECVYSKQKSKRTRWKKNTTQASHQLSAVKAADVAEHQPSSQTPQSSSEAAGVSSVRGAGLTRPLMGNSGAHTSPFKPGAPLRQHPAHLRVKRGSEEGDCAVGNVAGSFKDLFKTLDTI